MFCLCESNEKRPNHVRSNFADASVSRLIEDWGRSKVQPSYRLSKVRETHAALDALTWRKYDTKCRSWRRFFFIIIFNVVKPRKMPSFHVLSKKTTRSISTQSSPTTHLTHDKTRFSKGAVNLKVLKPLPHSSKMPKDQHIGHRNCSKTLS